jgi:sulfite reductase alpha subunit-like flavoprotein
MAMDAYQIRSLTDERLVVFVIATTGEGEAPDNMKKSWRFLRRQDLPRKSLADVEFAVFGMGDSSYEKFNAIARMMNSRLQQLGAKELVTRGLGDDQSEYGFMTDLDPWLQTFWAAVLKKSPLPIEFTVNDEPQLWEPAYDFAWVSGDQEAEAMEVDSASPQEGIFAAQDTAGGRSSSSGDSNDSDRQKESVPPGEDGRLFYLAPEGAYSSEAAASPCVTMAKVIKNERMTAADWDQVGHSNNLCALISVR